MKIFNKTDSELTEIAENIWKETIRGSNNKDWGLFSKHIAPSLNNDELRENIESQWEANKVLTTLSDNYKLIDILRREESVLILWEQRSTEVEGELLGVLNLIAEDGEIKVGGTLIK